MSLKNYKLSSLADKIDAKGVEEKKEVKKEEKKSRGSGRASVKKIIKVKK